MNLHVRLFATFSTFLPPDAIGDGLTLDLEPGTTVRGVLERLRIPLDLPGLTVINGHEASLDAALRDGDELAVFPPLAGGAPAARAHMELPA